jgi:hypothetical protein
MSFSNSKSFIVRSICATLIAALLLALFAMTAFAGAKNEDQTPSEETIISLAQKYLNERNSMLVSSKPDLISASNVPIIKSSEMSPQIAAQQRIDIEKIRKHTMNVEDMAGQYWNRFDTEVKISDIKVEPEKTTAHIHESTRLYFIPGKGSGYSSFGVDRHFTFVRNEAQWMISDVKVEGEFSDPPLNEPSVEPAVMSAQEKAELGIKPLTPEEVSNQIAQAKANDAKAKANGATEVLPAGSGGFDEIRVWGYCYDVAEHPNYYWYAYYPNADCTNFISQVLDQAGWRYYDGLSWSDYSWFSYRQGTNHFHLTNTFINAQRFFNHCNVRARVGWTYDYNSLRVGDVVQIDTSHPQDGVLDHSVIINTNNGWDYRLKYYSQHTSNKFNLPFTHLLEIYENSGTYAHWYVLMHTH